MEKYLKAELFSKHATCLFTQMVYAFQETITISNLICIRQVINISVYFLFQGHFLTLAHSKEIAQTKL